MALLRQTSGREGNGLSSQMSALNNSQNVMNQLFSRQDIRAGGGQMNPNQAALMPGANLDDMPRSDKFGRDVYGAGPDQSNWSRQGGDTYESLAYEKAYERQSSRDGNNSRYDQRQMGESVNRDSFFGQPLDRKEPRDRNSRWSESDRADGQDVQDSRMDSTEKHSRRERSSNGREADVGKRNTRDGRDGSRVETRPERNSSQWERNSDNSRQSRNKGSSRQENNWNENMSQKMNLMQQQLSQAAAMMGGMGMGMNPMMANNLLANMRPNAMGLLGGAGTGMMGAGMGSGMIGGMGSGMGGGMGSGMGTVGSGMGSGMSTGMGGGMGSGMGGGMSAGMGGGMGSGMGGGMGSGMSAGMGTGIGSGMGSGMGGGMSTGMGSGMGTGMGSGMGAGIGSGGMGSGMGAAMGAGGMGTGGMGAGGMGTGGMGAGMGSGAWQGMGGMGGDLSTYSRPNCRLEPPPPNLPPAKHKEKREGCKTIFIGGLAESVNDSILNEVFYVCGEIMTIRVSDKKGANGRKYCHMRFASVDAVDTAIKFSGFTLYCLGSEGIESCRMFVDYAESWEDEQDFEREKRAKAREERHKFKEEAEALARVEAAKEKPVHFFTDRAASELLHNIRTDELSFFESFEILRQWLERGECNRKTFSTFYALLSAIHSHIKRLVKEKTDNEEIVERQRREHQERVKKVKHQGETILMVFEAASQKKCWDHFSKAQRRNISEWQQWQKQVLEEIKLSKAEDTVNMDEVGMEIDSDDESKAKENATAQVESETKEPTAASTDVEAAQEKAPKKVVAFDAQDAKHRAQAAGLKALAEKNSTLMWEVEGYKNEVIVLKEKFTNVFDEKDMQIAHLTMALQGLQQYLTNTTTATTTQVTPTNIEVVVTKEGTPGNVEPVTMETDLEAQGTAVGQVSSSGDYQAPPTDTPHKEVPEAGTEAAVVPAAEEGAKGEDEKESTPSEEPKPKVKSTRKRGRKAKEQTPSKGEPAKKEEVESEEKVSKKPRKGKAAAKKEAEEKKKEEGKEKAEDAKNDVDEDASIDMEGFTVCDEVGPEDDEEAMSEAAKQPENEPQEKGAAPVEAGDSTKEEIQAQKSAEVVAQKVEVPLELVRLSEREMALVGVLCSYLAASPAGATGTQVCMHVQRHVPTADQEIVNKVLRSLPMLFQENNEIVGQTWKFCGFSVGSQY